MDHKLDDDPILILLRRIRGQLDDITDKITDLIENEDTNGGQ